MPNLYIYCEGQTEEKFVNEILSPHFQNLNTYLIPIICHTKETPTQTHKGGITDYNKVVKEVSRLCYSHPNEFVTTFIDFYGLKNLPPYKKDKDAYNNIENLESQLKKDIPHKNFVPYISLHEFESLLFSDPTAFNSLSADSVQKFLDILNQYDNNPELINNSPETAPSKRILKEIPNYRKLLNGILIAKEISLTKIYNRCPHFANWLNTLENLNYLP